MFPSTSRTPPPFLVSLVLDMFVYPPLDTALIPTQGVTILRYSPLFNTHGNP